MFEALTEKLDQVFKKLRSRGRLDENNIREALREIRLALLEADVHFRVVKDFIEDVRARAVGQEVLASITPGQQVVKVVHERLVELMGGQSPPGLKLTKQFPTPLMLVGLQGSGKTTATAKLAVHLRGQGRHPMMVAADVYRPAAIDQLEKLGEQAGIAVYSDRSARPEAIVAVSHDPEFAGRLFPAAWSLDGGHLTT